MHAPTFNKWHKKKKNKDKEVTLQREKKKRKTSVSEGDRRELSVCSIHPQSNAHRTKVWR
jgi:hypothetical protein